MSMISLLPIMHLMKKRRPEMPNKHKNPTIAFRPSSEWEHALINERIRLSGMLKRDFISKSIIYSRICMVGDKKNIRIIVNAVEQMEYVMKENVRELSSGDFCISDDSYMDENFKRIRTGNKSSVSIAGMIE